MGIALASGLILSCFNAKADEQEMTSKLVDTFTQAYAGSGVSADLIKTVYSNWIKFQLHGLAGINESMRDSIVSDMVKDRCRTISSSRPDQKEAELQADSIWTDLWPIEQRSEAAAKKVKQGELLSATDREMTLKDKEQLAIIQEKIKNLPAELQYPFGESISETTLDIAYSLNDGKGPQSLRLGHL